MPTMFRKLVSLVTLLVCVAAAAGAEEPWKAPDLNAVSFDAAPAHEPIVLVSKGQAKANLCLMGTMDAMAVAELQKCIQLATGVELPVVKDQIKEPALVIGDCAEARKETENFKLGDLAAESFAIKTAPGRVYL